MKRLALLSVSALALGACAQTTTETGDLQAQLDAANAKNAQLEAQLASGASGAVGTDALVPPNAKPGARWVLTARP